MSRVVRGGLEALVEGPAGMESAAATAEAPRVGGKIRPDSSLFDYLRPAAEKLARGAELSPPERAATEAIIIPDKRPAFDVLDGGFTADHPLWRHLEDDPDVNRRLREAIPAIGRIELPGQTRIPFAGTGFVVGRGLLMTNRHVAEIFARGVGDRRIRFRSGWRAALDFRRERDRPDGPMLQVRAVRMIHPWWDMALLEVEGLPNGLSPLKLALEDARDLDGRGIAVIGYPAYDPLRNDPDVQNELFDRTFGIKRLQPGELAGGRSTQSFGKLVAAALHDCSTLGGNSGSAVIDLDTGHVLALHFGGRYLDTNFAVPSLELARDGRVVDAGVTLAGPKPQAPAPDWVRVWNGIEEPMADNDRGDDAAPGQDANLGAVPSRADVGGSAVPIAHGSITFDVPLRITVAVGAVSARAAAAAEAAPVSDELERLAEPAHDADYGSRRGYDTAFLRSFTVPMPTARNPRVLAPLAAGGTRLDYQNFSILMHAQRRLALVTAANLTRQQQMRQPEPGRNYSRRALSGLGRNDREKWFLDPRLEARFQLPDTFFSNDRGAFDKGHLVRRDDVAWGETYTLLRRANGDTYHVTNCSPQVSQFNQSQRGDDNWGDLENLVMAEAADERLNLFAGPVLDPADESFVGRDEGGVIYRVKIPSRYWKVIVAATADGIAAYGFLLEQDLARVPLEFAVSENFRRLQVPLTEIEDVTGVDFGDDIRESDAYGSEAGRELARRGGLERVDIFAEHVAALSEQPTPNVGDDEAAEPERTYGPELESAGTVRPWRVARSLIALRRQVDARAPNRSKASDGSIGDAAHASRNSDHNPWVLDGEKGVVTAMDFTHDPEDGCDAGALAEAIVDGRDARVKYVIWNRRIANASAIGDSAAWVWRDYRGRNPHNKHVHISVRPEKSAYDAESAWPMPPMV